jgi:hypothetical protein
MTSPQSWDQAHTGPGGTGWGGGAGEGAPAGPPRNGLGVAAITLALIGAVLFWTVFGGIVLGLLAVILGILGFRRAKRGQATNGTLAMVGAVIGGLALVVSGALLVFAISLMSSGAFTDLEDCMQSAGTSSEQQKCQDDFVDKFSN